ncbi:MAG TPA: hypothetical protein VHQ47_14310 [Phycisphaerae bacterium]|nr:hypothetical protein [Phycisphaerae bacterium]
MDIAGIMEGRGATGGSSAASALAGLGGNGAGAALGAPAPGAGGFAAALQQAKAPELTAAEAAARKKAHEQAENAAGGLVANALILPILKQVRRSPWSQNNVFSGGNGEKTFGPVFDMQIADRLAHSPNMAVTHVLAKRLEKRAATNGKTKLDVHG